jgi:type IV pilus biogenesis protein CpaD/CtpE
MGHRGLLACSMLLLAGCAQQPAVTTAAAPQECEQTYRTGSIIPVRDCSPKLSEEERQRLIDDLQKTLLKNSGQKNTGGG